MKYEEYIRRGLCPRCGKEITDRKKTLCKECATKMRMMYQDKKNGVCPQCKKPVDPNGKYVLCDECRKKNSAANKETYKWRKCYHICIECGKANAFGGFLRCERCQERYEMKHTKFK